MMEPFSLATSQFIMNSTTQQAVIGAAVSAWKKTSSGTSAALSNEQELQPLKPCNRQNNGGVCEGKENGTCLSMTNNAGDSERMKTGTVSERIDEEVPEDELTGFIWSEKDSSATYVGQNAWHIPSTITFHFASRIRRLDLSFNCLQTLAGIEFFNCLEELVLDNNLLDDSIRFFYNPMMRILSINKNKITDLERFLNEISLKLPGLTYLSLLGNPACPDQLSSSDHDEQDYRRYRSYVVHRIPTLRFLDSTAIRGNEREEAQQRGHYYRLIRLNSDSFIEKQRSAALREEDYRQQSSDGGSAGGATAGPNGSVSSTGGKRQLTPLPSFDENNAPK
ncbi:hypothetical protein TYRP_019548, partial [Tyrophagus putrescentiae]